jgi:hypothetical protein
VTISENFSTKSASPGDGCQLQFGCAVFAEVPRANIAQNSICLIHLQEITGTEVSQFLPRDDRIDRNFVFVLDPNCQDGISMHFVFASGFDSPEAFAIGLPSHFRSSPGRFFSNLSFFLRITRIHFSLEPGIGKGIDLTVVVSVMESNSRLTASPRPCLLVSNAWFVCCVYCISAIISLAVARSPAISLAVCTPSRTKGVHRTHPAALDA